LGDELGFLIIDAALISTTGFDQERRINSQSRGPSPPTRVPRR
jgi:hypothetical protein